MVKEWDNQTVVKVDLKDRNPFGGDIAYVHPDKSTGARLPLFTMRDLIRRFGRYDIFSSCRAGRPGVATLIEILNR